MKRAAIYLRVSTSAQAKRNREPEGYSIPAQREACLRKAVELGCEVVAEFTDRGESAKTADRPQLQLLLDRVRVERDLDCVIVHKVDRLARNRYDDATISYTLKAAGVELHSVTENIDDTPFGRFMHAIVAANAEFYSANLAAEAKKGLVQKAKSGGTPTRAPIGYLNVRKMIEGREVRTVEVDPERAPHVRFAFSAYGSGAYTLDTLQAALEERGLRTRPTPTKPEKPISRAQLAKMLRNPYYIGTVRYAGVDYEGRHEPLVSKECFGRAQAVMDAHSHAEERDRKHDHYLKGSLFCGQCGARMGLINAKGNGGTYRYFFCHGRMRGTGCSQRYVPVAAVEAAVERAYGAVRPAERHVEAVRERLDHALTGMRAEAEQESARQRRRLAGLTEQRTKLLHAYYEGAVPLELLRSEQDRLAAEIGQAEAQLVLAEQSFSDIQSTLDKALDLLADCEASYAKAPPQLRRQWNQALFERFVIRDEEVEEAQFTEPFRTLADPRLPRQLARAGRSRALSGDGSNKEVLVGASGSSHSPSLILRASRV